MLIKNAWAKINWREKKCSLSIKFDHGTKKKRSILFIIVNH